MTHVIFLKVATDVGVLEMLEYEVDKGFDEDKPPTEYTVLIATRAILRVATDNGEVIRVIDFSNLYVTAIPPWDNHIEQDFIDEVVDWLNRQ